MVSQAIQTDVRTFVAEYRFLLADGTYGNFLDRAHIVRNEAGVGVRMIGAMIDVTAPLGEPMPPWKRRIDDSRPCLRNCTWWSPTNADDCHANCTMKSVNCFDLAQVRSGVGQAQRRGSIDCGGRAWPRSLARALETTDLLFARLRQIVRVLRPPVLEELGLKAGLEAMIADVQARTGLRCSLVFEQAHRRAGRLPTLETASIGLFRNH